MNKENFQKLKFQIQYNIKDLQKELYRVKDEYIEHNKPCNIDDTIQLTHLSGRIENVVVKSFQVIKDEVFISQFRSLKDGKESGPMRYITLGHGKIKIIQNGIS